MVTSFAKIYEFLWWIIQYDSYYSVGISVSKIKSFNTFIIGYFVSHFYDSVTVTTYIKTDMRLNCSVSVSDNCDSAEYSVCGIEATSGFLQHDTTLPIYMQWTRKNAIRLAVKVKLIWNLVSSQIKNHVLILETFYNIEFSNRYVSNYVKISRAISL